MRNKFADTLYGLAAQDPKLCVLVADISPAGSMEKFRKDFPGRFINTGVAEQIMIGMAAGMAQRGLRPFAYTIATFALYRPFEFIRDDLCYQDLPVTVVGIGGGRLYSTLGATHHAQEDIAVATSIPNLQVIAPCDPLEVEEATRWCAQQSKHPTYLRLGKAGEPVLTAQAATPWEFGKLRYLKRGPQDKICVISYGHTMKLAARVAQHLSKEQPVSLVCAHTLKPFDTIEAWRILKDYHDVIVVEECSRGTLYRELLRLKGQSTAAHAEVHGHHLWDAFAHCYGSHEAVTVESGLTLDCIVNDYYRSRSTRVDSGWL